MSSVSSPIHRYSGDYESAYYDQNFTADISNKMRVPSKILVTGGDDQENDNFIGKDATMMLLEAGKMNMRVPDRIIVAGHEQHMGVKAPPRELHLEHVLTPLSDPIRVETPPRVLTLEDHHFPTVDEDLDDEGQTSERTRPVSGNNSQESFGDDSKALLVSTPPLLGSASALSPIEEVLALRRHLNRLNRRLLCLEQDSQARQQRETIVYSLGVAYFVLKALIWLHRHW